MASPPSTAGLLELNNRRRYDNHPHKSARISRASCATNLAVSGSSFSSSSWSSSDSDSTSSDDSDSCPDSYPLGFVSPPHCPKTSILPDWLLDSQRRHILHRNPLLRTGNKELYEVRMEKERVKVRMDMPGVDKKGVQVSFSDGILHVRGVESEVHDAVQIQFSSNESELLNVNGANAQVKDGVLRIMIPKFTLEDKKKEINIPIK